MYISYFLSPVENWRWKHQRDILFFIEAEGKNSVAILPRNCSITLCKIIRNKYKIAYNTNLSKLSKTIWTLVLINLEYIRPWLD